MTLGDSNGSSGHGSGGDYVALIEGRSSIPDTIKDACESFSDDDSDSVVDFTGGVRRTARVATRKLVLSSDDSQESVVFDLADE